MCSTAASETSVSPDSARAFKVDANRKTNYFPRCACVWILARHRIAFPNVPAIVLPPISICVWHDSCFFQSRHLLCELQTLSGFGVFRREFQGKLQRAAVSVIDSRSLCALFLVENDGRNRSLKFCVLPSELPIRKVQPFCNPSSIFCLNAVRQTWM